MPTLNASPLAVVVPSQTRRRIWKHPELTSHSLVVLTFDRLHLAPLAGAPKSETLAAIDAGADLDDLLGPLATVVELAAVRRVKLDLHANTLILEYVGTGIGTRRVKVVFASPEAADACFTKTWRRLGDGLQLLPYKHNFWTLARAPLMLLGGVLIATAILTLLLSIFEDFAAARAAGAVSIPAVGDLGSPGRIPKSPLEILLGWLDWKVVCGVGGVAAAALQVWLYRRVTQPPAALEVVRT
jgi:hypothetical protein